ncbi:MAG: signal peptide peptidase SppA [Nitrospirota bacterium]
MKRNALLIVLCLLFLSGCAFVNVSLLSKPKPLEEEVLEGEGTPKILLVDLDGMISLKEDKGGLQLREKPSKVAVFREVLRKAEKDSDIVGVIVRINSPGGSVTASDLIHHEIVSFKQKRKIPVYAYIMEVGASGGYYIATATDRIFASPTAVTGSIGVVAMRFNAEGLFSKIGVANETYKSGPKKDFWSPFRPSTPEEQKMLQDIIDRLYTRFVGVVAANREKLLSEQEIGALADGRILTSSEALRAKLIDQIAYLDETVEVMKKTLTIDKARVITYARPGDYKSNIYSGMPLPGPHTINLISINAEDLPPFSGVQFMYLWNP